MNSTVQVISDVICPWCFIGKRRMEKALAAFGQPVSIRWLPFQLNPAMPKEGIARREYRIQKFGSWERSQQLDARVIAVGKEEGIDFAFDRIERTPNTVDAHRLIGLADEEGIQGAVMEGLFRAYFIEARDLTNRPTLLDVVAEAGLDRSLAESLLAGDRGFEVFEEVEPLSRRHQVEGVPFFIVDSRITLSGAQQPGAFLEAFQLAAELRPGDE